MTTPTLPPLPNRSAWDLSESGVTFDLFTADQMRDYALAAVKAYKASLKPVAYMDPEWVKGKLWPDSCFMDPTDDGPPEEEDWLPLYRLDDQP